MSLASLSRESGQIISARVPIVQRVRTELVEGRGVDVCRRPSGSLTLWASVKRGIEFTAYA
jgi:hypothetical protein